MAHKKTSKREGRSAEPSSAGTVLRQSATGAGISFLLTLLLTLICALLCSMLPDPATAATATGAGASFFCYLLAGILSLRNKQSSVLLSGMLSGGILTVLLLLAGLVGGGVSLKPMSWLLRFIGIGFSVMGAYLSGTRSSSRKRRSARSHGRS